MNMDKKRPDKASPKIGDSDIASRERPNGALPNAPVFGSDVAATALREMEIEYIALNPGASYRGLHDSIVNYLGNSKPQMLLCLHEEAAVAIAHGYAKVTGRPMAAAVHSNVGLMHASMAMFNAWCDRMPVVVIGATGPVDAAKRRPWIDWIHTSRDQGALVRHFVKWDDQPGSPVAARESILRACMISRTVPKGPTYVNLDAELQEMPLGAQPAQFAASRLTPEVTYGASSDAISKAAEMIAAAKKVLILAGRTSRSIDAWNSRIELAEMLGAQVGTGSLVAAAFPTDHPLHVGYPSAFPDDELGKAINDADLIISLDWLDLGGSLKSAGGSSSARIIQISIDHHVHNGWSMDYMMLPPVDLMLSADPDAVLPDLIFALRKLGRTSPLTKPLKARSFSRKQKDEGPLTLERLAFHLKECVGERLFSLTHLPISWDGSWWPFSHPLDYLGSDGGGGIGGGPGIAVGAALALKNSGRIPIAVCGDGDYLMGVTALWTAAHYRIPLLIVVANNNSFYNDEVHQERVARLRGRPVENKWIGQRIDDPDPDLSSLARAQGACGFGPVSNIPELNDVFSEAIEAVTNRKVAVVDVRITPGYSPHVAAAMLANKSDRGD